MYNQPESKASNNSHNNITQSTLIIPTTTPTIFSPTLLEYISVHISEGRPHSIHTI